MTARTSDKNVLNAWLTVGPASRLVGTSQDRPYTTQLIGLRACVWQGAGAAPSAFLAGNQVHVQIRYGYIWIWPEGTPGALFDFAEYGEAGRRIVDSDGIGVAVSGLRMIENFLDMGHFPFVHAAYLGEVPNTEVAPYAVRIDEVSDEIWATECCFVQPKSSIASTTPLEVRYVYRVMQPFAAMLYKTSFLHPGCMDVLTLFVQPVAEDRIIAYGLLAYLDDQSTENDLISFQHTIFGQDKPILENQVPKCLPLRPGSEVPARCDAASIAYRRWLQGRGMQYGAIVD
ncbi:hypothetical protein IP91_04093 [Pseudoduganella lurida]|uniref:Vanillate O-demethylase oxygenase-like C-terminal catalytic domain-containing protein n=1 Tax=Pseudoduganella lurida TaxID=1036180 RepID=A0A562R0H6_9BURK|nr:aromatic ring-hydroxylating dioxygenase subunit alpha [Pseudoduganella lurida]TWI62572.1 hypothetical protein IP91_04093 [Pseudoduganella lurida]